MLGIRALATFLRFWHDLVRVAYHRRRRIIAKITRPRPLAIARETLFDPYRSKLMWIGYAASFFFTANDIQMRWANVRSRNS